MALVRVPIFHSTENPVTTEVQPEKVLTEAEQRELRTPAQKEVDTKAFNALEFARRTWRDALVKIFPSRKNFASSPADGSSCNTRWIAITRLAQHVAKYDLYDRDYIIQILQRAYWVCKDGKIPVDDGSHDIGNIGLGSIIHIAVAIMEMEAAQREALPPSA